MTFKPKSVRPSGRELLGTVGKMAAEEGHLPTAPEPAVKTWEEKGWEEKGTRPSKRSAPPTVLVNFKATLAFAKLISEVSTQEGGVRRMVARMMKEAGHEVPEHDLNPPVNRRVYE